MTDQQLCFIKDEIWLLLYAGAFQHNSIYVTHTKEYQRKAFREGLRNYIEDVVHTTYNNLVSDQNHGAYILSIIDYTRSFSQILNRGELNVGTVQKILNLSLKYYWCLDLLPEPPHFPIDRIIQKLLPASLRANWTQLQSLEDYQSIIDSVRNIKPNEMSLAAWELEYFKRN